jgi:hypothetical protein
VSKLSRDENNRMESDENLQYRISYKSIEEVMAYIESEIDRFMLKKKNSVAFI